MEIITANNESVVPKLDQSSKKSAELIEEFLEYKRKIGKSHSLIRNYRYDIYHFINSVKIGDVEKVVVEDIEDYISILRDRKCAGATINRRLCALKALYKFFRRKYHRLLRREKRNVNNESESLNHIRALIEEFDDIIGLESVRAVKKEKLPFSLEEISKILSEIKKEENNRYSNEALRDFLIIKLSAIGTGARNTAIRQLLVKDLSCSKCNNHCDHCIPTINLLRKGKKEENKTKIRVRIEKNTCRELKGFIETSNKQLDDYVFISRKKDCLSISQMNRILYKSMDLAHVEIKERSFHSLRHTFITEGIKNGTPWGHMMIQVDHKAKLGITGKYEHMQPEDLIIHFPRIPENTTSANNF